MNLEKVFNILNYNIAVIIVKNESLNRSKPADSDDTYLIERKARIAATCQILHT